MHPYCRLRPNPATSLAWISRPEDSDESRIMRWVLAKGVDTPLQWSELGTHLDIAPANLLSSLYSLLRSEAIIALSATDEQPLQHWQAQGLAGLSADLGTWAAQGQCMLLASHDGMLLATTGWDARTAQWIAAQPAECPPSGVQQSLLYCTQLPLILRWTGSLPEHHPVQLRMACRLLRAFPRMAKHSADHASDHLPHAPNTPAHC